MKTAVLKMFLLALSSLMLCVCQAGDKGVEPEQDHPAEVQQIIQAYSPIITDCDIKNAEFSLIYLDDDAVPELVILDRYYNRYSIYTVKDSSAICLVDYITTVEMSYYEHCGVISAFYRWNGGGDEGSYANAYYQIDQHSEPLTDDSIPDFEFTYKAVYDENGQWTGTGTVNYSAKGEEIDEAAYHQIETDLNILQTDERSCFSETSECFTKDELLLYLEMTTTVEATS